MRRKTSERGSVLLLELLLVISILGVLLAPANSDVYYRVVDAANQDFDNCPHDGIKVYLASPLYPDDYKPLVLTSQ
jgi:hypothetical protein